MTGKNGGKRQGAGRKPGAISRVKRELAELAKEYGPEALETLAIVMRKGESEAARVAAADKLLDRGYGRPVQATTLTSPDGGDIRPAITISIVRPKEHAVDVEVPRTFVPLAQPKPA